jgi:hypothetical protein
MLLHDLAVQELEASALVRQSEEVGFRGGMGELRCGRDHDAPPIGCRVNGW